MFSAVARLRLALAGRVVYHENVAAAVELAARNAIAEEGVGLRNLMDLIRLGAYEHCYDRREEQLAIIDTAVVWRLPPKVEIYAERKDFKREEGDAGEQ